MWESLPHVNFVESGEHCVSVLGIFESLGYPVSHPVHLHLNTHSLPRPPDWLIITGTYSLLSPRDST